MAGFDHGSRKYSSTCIPTDFLTPRIESKNLTDKHLIQQCSDEAISEIAKKFIDWENASVSYLGIELYEVEEIKKDHKDHESERKKAVLDKWKEKKGDDATYICLIEAFYKAENIELLDSTLEYLRENSFVEANGLESGVDSDSSDAITEQEMKFLCGCGSCSLESFLVNGCENPLENKQYPLLNIKKLSQRQKVDLIARLEGEAYSIREQFSKLTMNVTTSLQNDAKKINIVEELHLFITSMQLSRFMEPTKKKEFSSNLKNCEKVADVMVLLLDDDFVSWFNHLFLGSIVEHFDVCKTDYSDYVKKTLASFLKKSLFEIPSNSFCSQGPQEPEKFVLKIDVPSSKEVQATIVPLLKNCVAKSLGITVSSLDLCTYNKGCIEITIGAPAQLLQAIFTSQSITDVLIDLGSMVIEPGNIKILSITYCDGNYKTVYTPDCKKTLQIGDEYSSTKLSKVDELFAGLVVEVRKFGLQQLRDALDDLSTHRPRVPVHEKFFTNDMINVLEATSVLDLIFALMPYWSFINFKLLQYIIEKLDPALKQRMDDYIDLLSKIRIAELPLLLLPVGTVDRFSYDPIILQMEAGFMHRETADKFLNIMDAVQNILHLEGQSVLLKSIDKNKNEIHVLVVMNAVGSLDEMLNFASSILLKEQKVTRVLFKGRPVLADDKVDDGLESIKGIDSTMETDTTLFSPQIVKDVKDEFSAATLDLQDDPKKILKSKFNSERMIVCEICFASKNSNHNELADQLCFNQFEHSNMPKTTVAWDLTKHPHLFRTKSTPRTTVTDQKFVTSLSSADYNKTMEKKGVLKVCQICLSSGHGNSELADKLCLMPSQHTQSQRIFTAWNSSKQCLEQIKPRPRVSLKGRFILCYESSACRRRNCTYAHSELERDAWNYDLSSEKSGGGFKGDYHIATIKSSQTQIPTTTFKSTSERKAWFNSYKIRLERALARDRKLNGYELSAPNYRNKFFQSLYNEELKHMSLLTEKCDGEYDFMFMHTRADPKYGILLQIGSVKGMTQDQLHYASQASSGVYFVDPETKEDICKAEISSDNFRSYSEEFKVDIRESDSKKLRSVLKRNKAGFYRANLEFDLKHSYFETLQRSVTSVPISAISKIMLKQSDDTHMEYVKEISGQCEHKQLEVDDVGQLHALKAVVEQSSHLPIVISGPFGSGKTRVIARAVYEIVNDSLRSRKPAKILVCAHHYNTTKTYVETYFRTAFKTRREVKVIRIGARREVKVIRIGHQSDEKSQSNILTYSVSDFNQYVHRGEYDQSECVVVVATYMSSINISEALNKQTSRQFTHVFLDEAAQPREPEAIAALCATNSSTKLVIAGDSKQVGPHVVVLIEDIMLQTSLLKRLEDEYTQRSMIMRKIFLKLGRNYRCHEKLTALLNMTMYDFPIEPKQIEASDHPDSINSPCVFHCYDTREDVSMVSEREIMDLETDAVINQLEEFLWSWPDTENWNKYGYDDICVISSNRTQLNMIKMKFKRENSPLKDITCLPSFLIQGHEFQAVFLCTTDYKDPSGLITNPIKSLLTPEIFNTVLSRSRSLVVAVGNPFVILNTENRMGHHSKCWSEYLKLCLKEKTISFPENIKKSTAVIDLLAQRLHIELPPAKSISAGPMSNVTKASSSVKRASSFPNYERRHEQHSRHSQKRDSRRQY